MNSFYSTIPLGISSGKLNEIKSQNESLPDRDKIFYNFAKPGTLRSWFVGVKATIMFEMPKPKECNCLMNDVTLPWKKTTPKKKKVE